MAKKTRGSQAHRRARISAPTPPKELLDAVRNNKCAVFVGAGLSAGAGFPTWRNLLSDLATKGSKRGLVTSKQLKEIRRLIDDDKLLMVAEELRERFGREHFEDELVRIFGGDRSPTETHKKLMQVPFSLAVTTNYDLMLEEAYLARNKKLPRSFTNLQPPEVADALWRGDYFILKAHGDVNNRASLVITERDYRQVIHSSHGYRAALESIFTTKTVLFVGASLSDPEVTLLLGYLHDAFHGSRLHFALMPQAQASDTVRNRWLKDFRVECITYKPTKDHPEVRKFMEALAK